MVSRGIGVCLALSGLIAGLVASPMTYRQTPVALGAKLSQPEPTPEPTATPRICPPPLEPREALRESDATFFGTVQEVRIDPARLDRREVVFKVQLTWTTGSVWERTVIDVPNDVWDAGRQPAVGEAWMIYADRNREDRLAIGLCDRSHPAQGADALGTGCDPVQSMWLVITPAQVQVGELFTATVRTRGLNFNVLEYVGAEPQVTAVLDPPCDDLDCLRDLTFAFRMRAVAPGNVYVWAGGFGEGTFCNHASRTWNWVHPGGGGSVVIRPAGPPFLAYLPRLGRDSPR